jgi:hypothetical protein
MLVAVAVALGVLGPGCSETLKHSARPDCVATLGENLSQEELYRDGRKAATLTLFAQAVPSAQMVPCVRAYPAGWSFERMRVRNGEARFTLDYDRPGTEVDVTLQERCDVAGASEVITDEVGARRLERINAGGGAVTGSRFYVFPGGCVRYDFHFIERGSARADDVTLALGFISREEIDRQLRRRSDGVEKL